MRVVVSFAFWLSLLANNVDGAWKPEFSRIIGGSVVKPHTFPWQVGLVYKGLNITKYNFLSFCGGTIICPKYILTAAHCFDEPQGSEQHSDVTQFDVMVGDHSHSIIEAPQKRYEVKKINAHERYALHDDEEWGEYDYAILELKEPIKLKKEARPIFLPTGHEDFGSRPLLVASGWGQDEQDERPDLLKSVTLPWISDKICSNALQQTKWKIPFSSSMFCAGDLKAGHRSGCSGDSGGPLAWIDPKTNEVKVIGITSFGLDDCSLVPPYLPEVFADVADALEWINRVTRGCNQKVCKSGSCLTKDKMDPSALLRFEHLSTLPLNKALNSTANDKITPHLEASVVFEN